MSLVAEHSSNPHRGKYLQRIRSLSSSQGGTCSPPSAPWLLSSSTHWGGKTHADTHTHKHTQSLSPQFINRDKEQWCKAADFELKATSPGAAVSWERIKVEAQEKKKTTGGMWKNEKRKKSEPQQWRSPAWVEPAGTRKENVAHFHFQSRSTWLKPNCGSQTF